MTVEKTVAGGLTRCVDFPLQRKVAGHNKRRPNVADKKSFSKPSIMDGSGVPDEVDEANELSVLLEDFEMDDAMVQDVFFGSLEEEEEEAAACSSREVKSLNVNWDFAGAHHKFVKLHFNGRHSLHMHQHSAHSEWWCSSQQTPVCRSWLASWLARSATCNAERKT